MASKFLSVQEIYKLIMEELKAEKKRWGQRSAEIRFRAPDGSGENTEIKGVRMGTIHNMDESLNEDCLILKGDSSQTYLMYGKIKLSSSLRKGEFLKFKGKHIYHIHKNDD